MNIRISPPEGILETTVARLPLSKSIAARLLVMNSLSVGAPAVPDEILPQCTDTQVLKAALEGKGDTIDIADCGTAARFVTARMAVAEGRRVTITGTQRMSERPMAPLVDALRALGADITYTEREGHLPIAVTGKRLHGGTVRLDAGASSQFASALAMIAPTMEQPLRIDLGGEIASMPYLKMTLAMLERRGVETSREGYEVVVANTPYRPCLAESEPDWSAAAFWYAIAGVTAGWVTLPGMQEHSIQGDSILATIGERWGVVTEFTDEVAELSATPDIFSRMDMDMRDNPDLVPPLAVTACLINTPFRFTGVANLRHKESDRIATLTAELGKCGWLLESGEDFLAWEGATRPITELPRMESHGDHRLAMSFAAIGAFVPTLVIEGAEAVEKSYPGFWDDLRDAGFSVEILDEC